MDKKTKIILGGLFIAAGVGLYLWDKNNDKATCNEGEVPCSNNPKICYSPNAIYKKNPCTVNDAAVAAPIAIATSTSGNIDIPSGNSEEQEAFIPITR